MPGGDERTIFIHVEGKEENIEGSWRNNMEVNTATGLFHRIAAENGWLNHESLSTGRIALTTPYTAQCNELNEKLRGIGCGDFKVESVAKMQGFECEVMILSCVRSNFKGVVGFLEDYRRLNVMLTRARLLTLIVGNAWTLCDARDSKGLWYELLQELSTRDCVVNENFETIVMPSHEKDTPHDDTWKLRRRSSKKKNGKDDASTLAARTFEKNQRTWVLNLKDREELSRRFFGVQESLSNDDLMHHIVLELLMRPYRHGGKGVDRWKMEPKLLDLKCWSYKGETHNVAAPCDETNFILHLAFQVILRNLPLWPSTIPANIQDYLENPPKTDEAWEVCADVPEALLGVLEPVDHQSQIFRTFLTEQYDVDCSKERIFQSRHHIDVLTETIRWMVYYGNISVQEILSKLPQKKTFGPTSLPRKTDAPPHPFLNSKERARKAGCLEPATDQKTVKWKEMPPDYIKHVGWPLPWTESNPVSSHPGSSWEVYGTGNNVTSRSPVASAQWVTRKPPNIDFDGENCNRFSKERKRRQIRCDACKKDCKGNDKGDFVDPDCRAGREDREELWKQGLLDATWVCVSCKPNPATFFKQRRDKRSEYKKVTSP